MGLHPCQQNSPRKLQMNGKESRTSQNLHPNQTGETAAQLLLHGEKAALLLPQSLQQKHLRKVQPEPCGKTKAMMGRLQMMISSQKLPGALEAGGGLTAMAVAAGEGKTA